MGLACAWQLAEAGRTVTLLERFTSGHEGGSSHGPTRIFRFVYDHPRYVAMARAALPLWRALETRTEELLRIRGGIDAGDPRMLERCADALAAEGRSSEWLDKVALGERFPWCDLPAPVLSSPDTGVIDAAETIRRLRSRAQDAGALLLEQTHVVKLEPEEDRVTIATEHERLRARLAVLATGSWLGDLLGPIGIKIPLRVTNEHVFYVDGPPETIPVIWRRERFFYTVPSFDGGGTIKIGEHVGGDEVDPDRREVHAPDVGPLTAWARTCLPAFGPIGARLDRCLYTITPDEDFVLDRQGSVIVVSVCSGHGFKFAPLIGSIVERLVAGAQPPVPIEGFSTRRF